MKPLKSLGYDNWIRSIKERSRSNLMCMRQFAEAWRREEIVQQLVAQLSKEDKLRAMLVEKVAVEPASSRERRKGQR